MIITQDILNNGEENPIKERLRESAAQIRENILNKPIRLKPFLQVKSNVAVAEVHIQGNVVFRREAISNNKSPIPIPTPKSQGGQFEPGIDFYSQRLMNTDAEYKVLSTIADALEMNYDLQVEGYLYLYTELYPCESCQDVFRQFEEKFPNMKVQVFWCYPYP
ncbi:deaminase domain-containing protein [Cylindrospermum sp. FACHB-282]|uniref:deaminase domain-containing protein n=1 Tax=Cylindrospermum sp. FACHB-282 TaxID=2692794 RepID=UPI00168447E9|nr:deaminase domain-containing protein [Cylindrospermum sp. FACHB-282]MBD2385344.1 hypothetical protein [Cylindrospermum sp. FACHB-282]